TSASGSSEVMYSGSTVTVSTSLMVQPFLHCGLVSIILTVLQGERKAYVKKIDTREGGSAAPRSCPYTRIVRFGHRSVVSSAGLSVCAFTVPAMWITEVRCPTCCVSSWHSCGTADGAPRRAHARRALSMLVLSTMIGLAYVLTPRDRD